MRSSPWRGSRGRVAPGTVQLAVVGRLVADKGLLALIEALQRVSWRDDDWCLNLYGSGPLERELRDRVEHLGLAERVVLHGHAALDKIWSKNHVLLLPSRREGMSLALQEAMQAGRAAVVTPLLGLGELVEDGTTGLVLGGLDSADIAEGLERLWLLRKRLDVMGAAAYERVTAWLQKDPGR